VTTAIDDPRSPGFGTGLAALVIAVLPAGWIAVFLVLGQIRDTAEVQNAMLLAEPIVLPIVGALALVVALFALWRDTRAGRVLAIVAMALVVLQAASVVALLLVV
jgi:chromate transport protein ChrA